MSNARQGFRVLALSPSSKLLDVKELADWLGVTPATIYRWRYTRTGPPGIKVGRHLRFRVSSVQAWLEEQEGEGGR